MKWLFDSADRYLKQCSWKDLALVKFCLFSMGLLCGIALPAKCKKPTGIVAAAVFVATYVPLMVKYFRIAFDKGGK